MIGSKRESMRLPQQSIVSLCPCLAANLRKSTSAAAFIRPLTTQPASPGDRQLGLRVRRVQRCEERREGDDAPRPDTKAEERGSRHRQPPVYDPLGGRMLESEGRGDEGTWLRAGITNPKAGE